MINKIRKIIGQHDFFKNVLILSSGKMIGFLVNFAFYPIIGRVYLPVEIGEYSFIVSSGSVFSEIITLGLIICIMLPKTDEDAKSLCQLILLLNIILSSLIYFILILLSGKFKLFELSIAYPVALGMMFFYLITFNLQAVYYGYANRKKIFSVLFWNPILSAITNSGLSIIFGVLSFGTLGYMAGSILSYVVCCVHLHFYAEPFLKKKISIKAMKDQLKQNRNVPLYQLPANLISIVGTQFPTQYFGRVFSMSALGGYTMAMRVYSASISMIASSINTIIYPNLSEKTRNNEPVGKYSFDIIGRYMKFCMIPMGILVVAGRYIMPFFFGSQWMEAGQFMAIIGLAYPFRFCNNCISGLFVVVKKTKWSLWWSIFDIVRHCISFGMSYLLNLTLIQTLWIYTLSDFIYQFLSVVLSALSIGFRMKDLLVFILKKIIVWEIVIYALYYILMKYICIWTG